ncbi:type II CRISPR-associated endonuclease Cas1 [Fructobacillus evanidus]|uniref:CRISPR-associated endonuclease Cas1 n=1 Tax=Fructobacillus evanidus TaxID=3064281 RepID=A0ABM9MPW9_9LACO|nr:CRISPR-Cas system-associated integrase Cas1 (Cas1) [Fructobacillus sp. LMG 32999]CAK1230658.1 CRISPR-Cas system-associated integrase Cas1 (Cas1) [Fructobacillus sp. LMG 32999]CAK1233924.1 CRISPR-Cas system-associated integrase Cas1 (Cas1) [Fructobacillus sp. LMG 32999]CAK1234668.1 CRISPR-Cas system-associated integrase Cas1 (Cas1) [Fructobacillus sp. LMG 32999]CAK1238771.1 CRISPR-Cas system-associated integrase Cas1 (Cas1) [Fructobacillus sp. LMG 32999]
MAWRTVLINEHAKINFKMNDINVQTKHESFQIPIDDIRVLILGNTRSVITSYAINELNKKHVKIITCDEKGMPVGEYGGYHENVHQNTNLQKQISWTDDLKKQLWQKIISTKIINQHQALPKDVQVEFLKLQELSAKVKSGDPENIEGQAARQYFPRMYGKEFKRSNEELLINAHLNYGYSILLSAVSREIVAAGYLTQLGVHHQSGSNAFNLASDLMEPFRPYIDRVVLRQQNLSLSLDLKLNLINVLNETINYNGKKVELAQAIQQHVLACLKYLSSETKLLPEMEFVL